MSVYVRVTMQECVRERVVASARDSLLTKYDLILAASLGLKGQLTWGLAGIEGTCCPAREPLPGSGGWSSCLRGQAAPSIPAQSHGVS